MRLSVWFGGVGRGENGTARRRREGWVEMGKSKKWKRDITMLNMLIDMEWNYPSIIINLDDPWNPIQWNRRSQVSSETKAN